MSEDTFPVRPPVPEPLPVPNAVPIAPLLVCSVREPGRPARGRPFSGPLRPGGALGLPGAGVASAVPFVGTTGGATGGVVVSGGSDNVITTPSSLTWGGSILCSATMISHTIASAIANAHEYSRTRCSGSAHSKRRRLSNRSMSRGGGDPAGVAGCNGVAMLHRYRRCLPLFRRALHLERDLTEPGEPSRLQNSLEQVVAHRLVTLNGERRRDRLVRAGPARLANGVRR